MNEQTLITDIYRLRFSTHLEFRRQMWRILCEDFFQKYIPEDSVFLELAPGYCEFINVLKAREKYGIDINPDCSGHAGTGVNIIQGNCEDLSHFEDGSLDVIFASNLLEHLTRESIVNTFKECFRCLKKGGRLMLLQPNIRYLASNYWQFWDHVTPIDDRAIKELSEVLGFSDFWSKSRFIAFTAKGLTTPFVLILLKIYLRLPFLHYLVGKQSFIIITK